MTLPTPEPWVHADAEPYWTAAGEGRLVLPRCRSCGTFIWYPRGFCPSCASFDVEWVEVPGTGSIYSFSIPRRGQGAYAEAAPYVLAYVELDLPDGSAAQVGPRVITNIVGCDPWSVAVGDRVEAVFHPTDRGVALVRFRPA